MSCALKKIVKWKRTFLCRIAEFLGGSPEEIDTRVRSGLIITRFDKDYMKKIIAFFVRHGETDLNKKDEFRGDLDVPLDKDGEQQAAALVPFFKNKEFSGAYGSTRLRVAQTMKPLMEAKNMKMKPLKALDSLDTGEFAGKPKDKENLKELKWYREHPQEEIPGGEKVQDFRGRVDAKIMSLIRKGESSAKPIIAGVHGSVIKEI